MKQIFLKKSLSIILSTALLFTSADFSVFAADVSGRTTMEKVWKEIAVEGAYKDYVRIFENPDGQTAWAIYPFSMKDDLTQEVDDKAVFTETETFVTENELEAEETEKSLSIEDVTPDTDSLEESEATVSDENDVPAESALEEATLETQDDSVIPSVMEETYDRGPEYLKDLLSFNGTREETAPADSIFHVEVAGEHPHSENAFLCTGRTGEEEIYSTFTLPAFLEEITPDPENCQVSLLLYPESGCGEVRTLEIIKGDAILNGLSLSVLNLTVRPLIFERGFFRMLFYGSPKMNGVNLSRRQIQRILRKKSRKRSIRTHF